ncbi:amidase domain-containing protein [Paenibacillus elgii]|uniref:amidase domain-containing protein n=1 Tax=Paenibacillus elgii TaxID=189691 RepID=UPI0013D237D4|nr:amidase domain-containing protein [Paenibacillus elgii]
MSWKTTLYDYVHHRNQMDIDYSVEPMLPFVEDAAYLSAQTERLARRADTDRQRQFVPTKSETRLTVDQEAERGDSIVADVTLRRTTVGEIRRVLHEEQRIERERITLSPASDGWSVAHIEYLQTEQALRLKPPVAGGIMQAEDSFAAVGLMRAPSVPYLNTQIISHFQQAAARTPYNRLEAARYADEWWDKANPAYLAFEVNCSNYVSQCIFAGGAPMNYTGKRDSGWWYKGRGGGQEHWSFSWAVAESLQFHLLTSRRGLRAQEVANPQQLDLGDVISYDWDGDGRYQHTTIVTAKDPSGMPLVNAQTINSKHRYWSYTDSPAWTKRTRYRFLHLSDSF